MKARLIQIGWVTLTLISLWVFAYILFWLYQYAQNPPAWLTYASAETGISLTVAVALNVAFILVVYACYFGVAQLIMLRRVHERLALLAAIVLICFGTANAVPSFPEYLRFVRASPPYFGIPYYLISILGWTLASVVAVTYPDGQFVPRWTRWVAGLGFLVSLAWTTNPEFFSTAQGLLACLLVAIQVWFFGAIVYAQVWRYRHYLSPLQKQQVKWFVYGMALTILGIIPSTVFTPILLSSGSAPAQVLWVELFSLLAWLGIVALPLSVGIAILRYRLWDIDIIIRKTLLYSILTGLLAMTYFGSVVILQSVFAAAGGQRSELVIVASTLVIAALFFPLRRRVQNTIDRRFYRRKYDAARTLATFGATVRDETDLDKLMADLVTVVNETMQPKEVSVWLRQPEREVKR